MFEYIAEQPAEAEAFAQAMKSTLTFVSAEVARFLDTRSATLVADIGGVGGALLHAVLERTRRSTASSSTCPILPPSHAAPRRKPDLSVA